MAIISIVQSEGSLRYFGLSTDTKPPAVLNYSFYETDTTQDFIGNGTSWVPQIISRVIIGTHNLPSPVNNVIQLENYIVYNIVSSINIGTCSISVGIKNSIIGKDRLNDQLISTTTGNMFILDSTLTNNLSLILNNITVSCGSGTLFDIKNTSISISESSLNDSNQLATINGCSSFTIRQSRIANIKSTGIVFNSATNGNLRIFDNIITNNSGTLINLGTALLNNVFISRNDISTTISNGFLSGVGDSNVSTEGNLSVNIFSGSGSVVSGFTVNETKWRFLGNYGVTNSIIDSFELGSGVANTSNFLRGDQTWATIPTTAVAASGGLASTGGLFTVYSASPLFPNSRIITAGSSVTVTTDATSIYISALTPSLSANSGGLMGTGGFFVAWSSDTTMSNEKVLTAGSSVTMHTDSTAIYINATTGAGGGTTQKGVEYYWQTTVNTGAFRNNKVRMYVAGIQNATALGATVIPINSACCVPFYTTKSIVIDTFGSVNTIAGSATSLMQLAIYTNSSDTVLYPFQSVSSSGLTISNTNTTLMGYNPAITLSANNLYWFVCYLAKSATTMRTVSVGGAAPIFGLGTDLGTAVGIYLQCPITVANSSLSGNMATGGNIIATAMPALAIRGSV